MGNIKIKVDVKGGMTPVPILVFIDKVKSNQDVSFKREVSFEENFIVSAGEYNVIISGENPNEGQTDILVTYTNEQGISSTKSFTITKEIYSKIFKALI